MGLGGLQQCVVCRDGFEHEWRSEPDFADLQLCDAARRAGMMRMGTC